MNVQDNKVDRTAMIGLEMGGQGAQIADQTGGSRGLSRIRPQMMQQVLSSFAQEKKAAPVPTQMELLQLFPESRTPWEQGKMASSYPSFSNGVTDCRSVPGSSSEQQSAAELIIFYNGAVKAYHVSADKAQAVLELADSNASSERATLKPSRGENQQAKKLAAGLPRASKLSLQCFIQKRKERLGSLSPYKSTEDNKRSSGVPVKKEDEDENQQICLSLSSPSQRSASA